MEFDQLNQFPAQSLGDALFRISKALGANCTQDQVSLLEPIEILEILEQAAYRLEKAARLMDQLQFLQQVCVQHGFKGSSASQVIAFAQKKIQQGSNSQAVKRLAKACEALDPELAFHDAHLSLSLNDASNTDADTEQLLGACLRIISISAGRMTAQETTIVSLVSSLQGMTGEWNKKP